LNEDDVSVWGQQDPPIRPQRKNNRNSKTSSIIKEGDFLKDLDARDARRKNLQQQNEETLQKLLQWKNPLDSDQKMPSNIVRKKLVNFKDDSNVSTSSTPQNQVNMRRRSKSASGRVRMSAQAQV